MEKIFHTILTLVYATLGSLIGFCATFVVLMIVQVLAGIESISPLWAWGASAAAAILCAILSAVAYLKSPRPKVS